MSLSVEQQLAAALAECERLRAENQQLRERQGLPPVVETAAQSTTNTVEFNSTVAVVTSKSSSDEKVKLFRSLFRGREDVYAARWEGRNGKTGYSPAHRKIWSNSFQKRPDRPKDYFPLTDQVIHDHLTGKLTAGVYRLLTDETCWFLAADFDKATWQDDVRAFLQTCANWKIPAALERSRSGRGGHVWIFFDAPLPADLARKLGAAILTRTMERRHQLGLDSYDRFFPNPDEASVSSPRDNPCYGIDPNVASLNVHADDEHSYLLPYAQLLYAETIPNPALEKNAAAPPEKLLICFAAAEVTVLGSGLQAVARKIQKCDLNFVKAVDRRFAASLKTHVAAVAVNFTKQ